MSAASDRLRALVAEATRWNPSDLGYIDHALDQLEELAPKLALLVADMGEALAKHGSEMPRGQYVNHAEADSLLIRLAALFPKEEQ